jgi:protein involved in polysaccharide export with SLBB domain
MMRATLAALTLTVLAASLAFVPARAQDRDPTRRDPDQYRLRVGDEIQIVVSNGNKVDAVIDRPHIIVPGNGDVSFAPIGKIHLADRTTDEVQQTITQKLKDENFLGNPIVGCVVTHYEPRYVYFMGSIHARSELPIHRNARILEVLAQVGGLGAQGADFSHVRVRRVGHDGSAFPIEVNVDEILEKNQEQQNIILFENDIIIVPKLSEASPQSAEWVYVLGKVKGAGRQPIVKGRTPFTLTKLIAMCGDFQEFADRTKVRIIRITPIGRESTKYDFDDIIEGKAADVELKPDDLIYVPETWI